MIRYVLMIQLTNSRMIEPTKYDKYEVQSLLKKDSKSDFAMERIFNVYKQHGAKHFYYNILNRVDFPENISPSTYTKYHIKPSETWTLISFKFYARIDLWWIIAAFNKIDDTFKPLEPGTTLMVPTPEMIRNIIDDVKNSV